MIFASGKYKICIGIVLLAATILLCKGAGLSTLLQSAQTLDTTSLVTVGCCGGETTNAANMEILHSAIFSGRTPLQLSVVFFSLLAVFFIRQKVVKKFQRLYYIAIRNRFGSFVAFAHIAKLFRFGILHPKTW